MKEGGAGGKQMHAITILSKYGSGGGKIASRLAGDEVRLLS